MNKFLLSVFVVTLSGSAFAQIPAGYYDGTDGLTGAALKTKLSEIITNGHRDNGYDGLWTGYKTTDRDYFYENDGTILDMYSENPTGKDPYNFTYSSDQCGSYQSEGGCYNREHVVPQSLFGSRAPMHNDIHFIRATDGKVNGMRSNYPYGKVGSATYTSLNGSKLGTSSSTGYGGTVFEPIDNFKGDVARMIFYFVTRYESQLSTFSSGNMLGSTAYPGLQKWELDQLLAWSAADPVSAEEIARNNASYTFQGNRNPYIDHPEWVSTVWSSSPVTPDNQAPTAALNLATTGATSNSVSLSWTAATDNVAVTSYDIYVNGVFYQTVSGSATAATVTGLAANTSYTFYIIAKDAAGNVSPQSNTVQASTNNLPPVTTSCGTEDFSNIPSSPNPGSYVTRTWTNNGITWTATDARTDQTMTGKAIVIRNGQLSSSTISGGVGSVTVTTQLFYSGSAGNLDLYVNSSKVGTVPYSTTATTTTVSNININGNATIRLVNPVTDNRVGIDNLSWTCSSLGTAENSQSTKISIYPNPVRNSEIFIKGNNINKISEASIYSLDGRLLQSFSHPFSGGNKLAFKKLPKGIYLLKLDKETTKFIVE